MYDFIKVRVLGSSSESLVQNPLLNFDTTISDSGEIKFQEAMFRGLKFRVFPTGLIIFHGSLHKYRNHRDNIFAPNSNRREREKGFNGNNYYLHQVREDLNELAELFGINLRESELMNLEFGVNVPHHYHSSSVLGGLLLHKGIEFTRPLLTCYKCRHSHFNVKCYDKSKQYKLSVPLMRFEIQYRKMEQLNKKGVRVLSDLLDKTVLGMHKIELLKRWDEILYFDFTFDEIELTDKDKKFLIKTRDINYWINLPTNRRDRPKRRLNSLVNAHSEKVHFKFKRWIGEVWDKEMCND